MTRLLAWSTGAALGYVVGWLAGSNVQRMAEGRRLARPGVPVRPVEARNAGRGTSGRADEGTALRTQREDAR